MERTPQIELKYVGFEMTHTPFHEIYQNNLYLVIFYHPTDGHGTK